MDIVWGVEPQKGGTWERLEDLLFEVLCNGDRAVFDYVMNWTAHMVQHPETPAETAICFHGGKGVGKSTWFRMLMRLTGKHGMQITSSNELTDRFNSHLRDTVFLFADEAIEPDDRNAKLKLKELITENTIVYEKKGHDASIGQNRIHVGIVFNEDQVISMDLDFERRFLVQPVNVKRQGQYKWFNKLHQEMKGGGYSMLLWDLLHRDIVAWSPHQELP